jgi:hypothetical protein
MNADTTPMAADERLGFVPKFENRAPMKQLSAGISVVSAFICASKEVCPRHSLTSHA